MQTVKTINVEIMEYFISNAIENKPKLNRYQAIMSRNIVNVAEKDCDER